MPLLDKTVMAVSVCEGQKVPQSPKPRKIQSKGNEKVTLGVDLKVTKK